MHKLFKPTYYRIILYVLYIILIKSCKCNNNELPPLTHDIQTKQQNAAIPFNKTWTEKLKEIPDSNGKKHFESNLKQLSITEPEAIWELLNVIQDPTKQESFLSIFMGFSQSQQESLFSILLYLRERDKPLLCKLIDPDQELTIMEKIEMWKIIKDLSESDQKLIESFKEKLDKRIQSQ